MYLDLCYLSYSTRHDMKTKKCFGYKNPYLEFYVVGGKTPSKAFIINHTEEQTPFNFKIEDNTHLLIRNYCYTCNSRSEPCIHTMGTCLLPICSLKEKNKAEFVDYCSKNNDVVSTVIFEQKTPLNVGFQSAAVLANCNRAQDLFDKYIMLSLQHYDNFSKIGVPSTKNLLARIHSPYLQLQSTNVVLPSSLYTLPSPVLRDPVEEAQCKNFYSNMNDIVMENMGLTERRFKDYATRNLHGVEQSETDLVMWKLLGSYMTFMPNTEPYIHDFYRKDSRAVDNDRYSLSIKNGGDCEDFAKLSHTMFNDIQRLFKEDETTCMGLLCRLYNLYVPIIQQGAVSNASFSFCGSGNILNHVFFVLYPRQKMSTKLGVWDKLQQCITPHPLEKHLPMLICEGTGLNYSIVGDTVAYPQQYYEELRDLVRFKTQIESKNPLLSSLKTTCFEPNRFYKYMISGFTDYYHKRGFDFLEVSCMNGVGTYGIAYDDYINFNGDIVVSYYIDPRDGLIEKAKTFLKVEPPIEPFVLNKGARKCLQTTQKRFFPKLTYTTPSV